MRSALSATRSISSLSFALGGRHFARRQHCRRGVGDVARGMTRQGGDLQLTEDDAEHWRATFYVAGRIYAGDASGFPFSTT